jgi:hypothetical protein
MQHVKLAIERQFYNGIDYTDGRRSPLSTGFARFAECGINTMK